MQSYLAHQLDLARHVAWFEVDENRIVRAVGGRSTFYRFDAAVIGQHAEVAFPYLTGMFEDVAPRYVFPFVQMPSGGLADIHVVSVRGEHGGIESTFAIILDTSSEAYRLEAVQQSRNEHALRGISPMHASLLTLLGARDALLLEPARDTQQEASPAFAWLRVLSPLPTWADALTQSKHVDSAAATRTAADGKMLLHVDTFPFLEAFLPEAVEFWRSKSRGLLQSTPWVQTDGNGNEISLQVSAVHLENHGGLLIVEVLGSTYHEKRSLLQRARERSLEQERLSRALAHQQYMLDYISRDLAEPVQRSLIRIEELLAERNVQGPVEEILEAVRRECHEHVDGVRKILAVFGRHTSIDENYNA